MFDRFINARIEGAEVNKGLYVDEDEEEDEDAALEETGSVSADESSHEA